MKSVLVTGATGFIGRHAVARLAERGFEVHAVSRRPRERGPGGAVWHAADLLDLGAIPGLVAAARATHCLHLAWYAEHRAFWTALENVRWVEASLELALAFAASGGRRIVFAGTCAEYDWRHGRCSERTTPLEPATLYGAAKHGLQVVAASLAAGRGLGAAWGRLFHLFGPGEHPDRFVPSLVRPLLAGETALCRQPDFVRDLLYVEDAAGALAALLDSEVGGAVNIASGRPVRLGEVARRIAAMIGGRGRLEFGAAAAASGEPAVLSADCARLGEEVRWRPAHDLDAGLAKTVEWWRERGGEA